MRISLKLLAPLLPVILIIFATASSANASVAASPGWSISSLATPSTFSTADSAGCTVEGGGQPEFPTCDSYEVIARNTGKLATETSSVTLEPVPVVLSDTVPAGLDVQEVRLFVSSAGEADLYEAFCSMTASAGAPTSVKCEYPGPYGFLGALPPDATLRMVIFVKVDPNATFTGLCPSGLSASTGCVINRAEMQGGGAPMVETTEPASRPNVVNGPAPSFGFSNFAFDADGPNGALDTQAGDHPYELDVTIDPNTEFRTGPGSRFEATGIEEPRDVVVDLPVGFLGSVNAAPQCTFSQLASRHITAAAGELLGGCPGDTVVGHILTEPRSVNNINSPLYNMTPERGYPAEFAYLDVAGGTHVLYTRVVPTPKGYVLQTVSPAIPTVSLKSISVQFYGVPAERDHSNNQPIPFFTDPSDCTGEEPTATIYMDSWEHPAKFNSQEMPVGLEEEVDGKKVWVRDESHSSAVTGCNTLQFPAEIEAKPTSKESDKPTGLNFGIKLPQTEIFGAPGTPTLKKIVTKLPEGLTVDPAAGDGLQACSANPGDEPGSAGNQIGWLGPDGPNGPSEPLPNNGRLNFSEAPPACPEASKIGDLALETPLLPAGTKVKGEMFLAAQNENPYGSTLGAYVVVHDPVTGILIKIAGEFLPDPHTGQLTAIFDENPNLPFSNLELRFFGGPRAELATPESCATFATDTELFPYSFEEGEQPTFASNTFTIDEACPDGAFAPSFSAGSANLQAGAFTTFGASFERSDTEQELAGLEVKLPPGLSANIANVPECSDRQIEQAEAGTGGCPEASRVGTVKAGVGPGPDPFFATGKAYWTGPYNGGPFGLAVVVPAIAGPFNFGTVVVRQSIRLDPRTAQVTDVSDKFPTIIDGIPLRMRRVDVELNRPGFTFNPTSCNNLQFVGTISGFPLGAPTTVNAHNVGFSNVAGPSSAFTTPFQVTNCGALAFAPKFSAAASGKVTKVNGTSLSVKLTYPKAPLGTQANIAKVKVELPKQLPSRLSTLQKACTQAQFQANPAGCPAASVIGHVKAVVPNIPVPLEGPVYFVSNGGEAFPNLVMVLQGDNVKIELVGDTLIKGGVTSTTFKAVPDNPVTSFELTLHNGPYSALTGLGNLCKEKLLMPTQFTAQNGAILTQQTKIAVTGCPKAHKAKKKAKHRKKHRKAKKQFKSLTVEFKR